jgi:polyribonucleotide nucleotidyltransferase
LVKALEFGHNAIQPLLDLQEKMAAEIGKPKLSLYLIHRNEELAKKIFERVQSPPQRDTRSTYEKADPKYQI